MIHVFTNDLSKSHTDTQAAWLEGVYRKFFPTLQSVLTHNGDSDAQRLGVDKTVVLRNGKTIWIDEKLRYTSYPDILIEEYSDKERGILGWASKPLLADYICYVNLPGKRAYLLPVQQLQSAWAANAEAWKATRRPIFSESGRGGKTWTSQSWGIEPRVLFPAIGAGLRTTFDV